MRRGFLLILAGTGGGQLLALLAAPVISRLFTPEDFGVFATINALVMVVGVVGAFKLESAVPLPRGERRSSALMFLGLAAAASTGVVGLLLTTALLPLLPQWDRLIPPELARWLWVVAPLGAMVSTVSVLNQWAVRRQMFDAVGRRSFLSPSVMVGAQIAGGSVWPSTMSLVAGLAAGQAASLLALAFLAPWRTIGRVARKRRFLGLLLRRYRRFPLVLMPSGLVNSLGLYSPVLLVLLLFGPVESGWFGLTQRVLATPVSLVGQSLAQVYLSHLVGAVRTDTARAVSLFRSVSAKLLVAGLLIGAAMAALAPAVFPWLFGPAWQSSGEMAQVLSLALAGQVLASPVSQTLVVCERVKTQLAWDLLRLLGTGGSLLVAWALGGSAVQAVAAYSISSAACYLVLWLLCRHAILRVP